MLREAPGNGDGGELGDQHLFHPINKKTKQTKSYRQWLNWIKTHLQKTTTKQTRTTKPQLLLKACGLDAPQKV